MAARSTTAGHGREVHHRRHAGEVLEDDARGGEGDLPWRQLAQVAGGQRLDVGVGHAHAVFQAQHVLKQYLQGVGQARDLVLSLQRVEPEDLVGLAADVERGTRLEAVLHGASG
jgi:hypothetical protein